MIVARRTSFRDFHSKFGKTTPVVPWWQARAAEGEASSGGQPLTTQEIVITCFCTVVFAGAIAAVTAQAAAASEETKISDNSEALCKFDPQALTLPSSVAKFLAALDERLPVVDHPSVTK
jgi:hypothetical protein